jgi:fatty acid desaturase
MTKRKTYNETVPASRVSQGNYVPARYEERRENIQVAPRHEVAHIIDVPMNATQHIEMKTSAVDRAKGFLIASVPLYLAFALGVLLLSVLFAGVPFFSFWSLAIFWLSFVLAWLWGYRETLMKSAEGIAYMEASRKWDIVEEEQRRRWEHYDRQLKGDE